MLRGEKMLPTDDESREGSVNDYHMRARHFSQKDTPTVKAKYLQHAQYQ